MKQGMASRSTNRTPRHIPPALNPTPHFKSHGRKCEIFGRIAHCHTGHGYLGARYATFTPDESTACTCGEPFQKRKHMLQHCARYNEHRHLLPEDSRGAAVSEILGTLKGVQALLSSSAFPRTASRARPPVLQRAQRRREPE